LVGSARTAVSRKWVVVAIVAVAAVVLAGAEYSAPRPSSTTTILYGTTVLSTPPETPNLSIVASYVSHTLEMTDVGGTCGASPSQGASYLEVRNNGTASTAISVMSFSYEDMAQVVDTGVVSGTCTVDPGATLYITITGVGENVATAGEMFTVSLTGTDGAFTYGSGSFA